MCSLDACVLVSMVVFAGMDGCVLISNVLVCYDLHGAILSYGLRGVGQRTKFFLHEVFYARSFFCFAVCTQDVVEEA